MGQGTYHWMGDLTFCLLVAGVVMAYGVYLMLVPQDWE